ncbi:uncharacterized protein F4812DRAFT_461276 [Daldinia caldariorum]|uniref:uncharacterized protein n=1 Tax=Daldinia caldariorum TaxID=326644 RepID=UPI0020088C08|nr:uncharacterized protein F4812DRAFT_461276 [Daldinia caldariorum]KAI1465584.1 hypothetical protein F4812DRAFT_461276 [Daldinia caldariorum]
MDVDTHIPTGSFEKILESQGLSWTHIRLDNGLKATLTAAWRSEGVTSEVAQEHVKEVYQGMMDAYMQLNYRWESNIDDLMFQHAFLSAVKDKVHWVRKLSDRELGRLIFNFKDAREVCLKQRREASVRPTTKDSEIARLVQQFMDMFHNRVNQRRQTYRGYKPGFGVDNEIIPFECAKPFIIHKEEPNRRRNSVNYASGPHYVGSDKGPFLVPQRRKPSNPLKKKKEDEESKKQEDSKK